MSDYDNGGSGSRPTKADGVPRRVAGDRSHGGAGQDPKWNRNSAAHTTVAFPAAAAARNGDELEKSGGDLHGQNRKQQNSSAMF